MPACAVASRTPAICGISGTSVGARGETAEDMMNPFGGIVRSVLHKVTQNVNGRDKPGHDDLMKFMVGSCYFFFAASGAAAAGFASAAGAASSLLVSRRSILAS